MGTAKAVTKRVLVTGSGGQVGSELVPIFAARNYDVTGVDHQQLPVEDRKAVLSLVHDLQPQYIVHAAAWTAVDLCESDPEKAMAVNANSMQYLVEAAEECGARICYISTDYVFDGTKDGAYVETDRTNPQSVYGRSKLAGEQHARAVDMVARTAWVCGAHGNNMVKTILRLEKEHERLSFVDDQRGCPTFARDLATRIVELVELNATGIFHVTNSGAVSWYEFACEVLRQIGADPDRVTPITTDQLQPPRPAPRPANSVLDNAAMRALGLPPMDDFRIPLAQLLRDIGAL